MCLGLPCLKLLQSHIASQVFTTISVHTKCVSVEYQLNQVKFGPIRDLDLVLMYEFGLSGERHDLFFK